MSLRSCTTRHVPARTDANKPFNLDEIVLLVEKVLETTQLRREKRALRSSQAQPYRLDRIVGESEAIGTMRALLKKVAASPASTILLTGESGTGKDLFGHERGAFTARIDRSVGCVGSVSQKGLSNPEVEHHGDEHVDRCARKAPRLKAPLRHRDDGLLIEPFRVEGSHDANVGRTAVACDHEVQHDRALNLVQQRFVCVRGFDF